MSSSATHARHNLARRIPAVAAPVLGVAATAIAVVGTPAASMAATHSPAGHHAPVARTARVASVTRTAAKTAKSAHKAAAPVTYTVRSGDTLSSIAGHYYRDARFWTAIYQANKGHIEYADSISIGQVLKVPAKPATAPAAPSALSAPAPQPVRQPVEQQSAPVQQSAPSSDAASTGASTTGDSAFQSCVISRESGGDSQVMNSSGHYGLYQFSASTWAEYGGNPSDFGNASASEQNQVFDNAMAQGGESNWSAYDGC